MQKRLFRPTDQLILPKNLSAVLNGNKSIEIFLNVIRISEMASCILRIKTCWKWLMLCVYHNICGRKLPEVTCDLSGDRGYFRRKEGVGFTRTFVRDAAQRCIRPQRTRPKHRRCFTGFNQPPPYGWAHPGTQTNHAVWKVSAGWRFDIDYD